MRYFNEEIILERQAALSFC